MIECALFAAKSLQDMLIQSWGDKIRVFPAIPVAWKDVVFRDLRAEGAFLVSAARKDGRTRWIRVKSLAGEPRRIKSSLSGEIKLLQAGKTRTVKSSDGVIEFKPARGQEALLFSGNTAPDTAIAPVHIDPKKHNAWGSKK